MGLYLKNGWRIVVPNPQQLEDDIIFPFGPSVVYSDRPRDDLQAIEITRASLDEMGVLAGGKVFESEGRSRLRALVNKYPRKASLSQRSLTGGMVVIMADKEIQRELIEGLSTVENLQISAFPDLELVSGGHVAAQKSLVVFVIFTGDSSIYLMQSLRWLLVRKLPPIPILQSFWLR